MSAPTTSRNSTAGATPRQRDYYERDVEFKELAKSDPEFAQLSQNTKSSGWFDFQDPKVVQQLTKSILKQDFNLELDLPPDRLCPPVPVRWNYVRWIQDLLDTTNDEYSDHFDPERAVLGLDIGVGASCIYALLACSSRPEWRMLGTDIDEYSLKWASENVKSNHLDKRIKLKKQSEDDKLVDINAAGIEEMDFVMTNPPFYSSQQDFEYAYKGSNTTVEDKKAPSSVTSGAPNEMICPGGDVGFVMRIIEESLVLRERVQWYTAMLSKLSSLQQIVAKLKEHEITNWAVTSLHPGHKTKRWAVAWSFRSLRPRNDVARHGELVLNVLPAVTAHTIKVPLQSAKWAGKVVNETMKGLDVQWRWRDLLDAGLMQCKENVWSRAARRKKKFGPSSAEKEAQTEVKADEDSEEEDVIGLAVKITCKEEEVEVRWLRGHDHLLFESFCGMLKRALVVPNK